MKNLFNIIFLACALVLFGCGDDQSNRATPTVTNPPATTPGNDTKMEKTEKMEKPAWAVLEQNVYHYPE